MIALALSGAVAASDEAPSLELLLHLAEFADADGQPVDPQGVADAMEATEGAVTEPAMSGKAQSPTGDPATPADRERARKPREHAAQDPREDDDED